MYNGNCRHIASPCCKPTLRATTNLFMKLPGSSVQTVLLSPRCFRGFVYLFYSGQNFLFYKATGQEEILCRSPWDCPCQQQKIPSCGKSNAGRTEVISNRVCDGCSGGTSLADTYRQLLMLCKSFCAGFASCMTYVMGRAIVPVQHPLQGSCQC